MQISSLVTTCRVVSPLLTFWSHPKQSWMFALTVSALNIIYCRLFWSSIAYIKFGRDCKLGVYVHLVNFFCRICLHIHVNDLVWHSRNDLVWNSQRADIFGCGKMQSDCNLFLPYIWEGVFTNFTSEYILETIANFNIYLKLKLMPVRTLIKS